MRGESAAAAVDDLILLLVAVFMFSLFFASLAAAFVARASWERGARLQEVADAIVRKVRSDPRWTQAPGVLLASGLDGLGTEDLATVSSGHPFRAIIWDVLSDHRWIIGRETQGGDQRTRVG
ncbi:MAG TPA: hypothetical protein VGR51_00705, partial [Thermoplasmata archaeon]|nr:hypothetical protein [Thermoplasmata archaeon]